MDGTAIASLSNTFYIVSILLNGQEGEKQPGNRGVGGAVFHPLLRDFYTHGLIKLSNKNKLNIQNLTGEAP